MQKKMIITVISSMMCFIFLSVYYLSTYTQAVEIIPFETNKQKTEINLITSWGAYDSKAERLNKILRHISSDHPELEICNASMAGEDFLFILKTDFARGEEADLFGLWPGTDFRLLVKRHKVADLTEVLKEDPEWYGQFKEEAWDYVTVDHRIYGLPIELVYEGLFVNQDLFEAYGVKVPTNFEELLEAVTIFKEKGIIPIAYNRTPEGSYLYQNIVMKLGGKDAEQPFDEKGKIKPCYVKGMYYMKQLYEAGAFPSNFTTLDDKARNQLFLDKKAAMIVQGSWFIGDKVLNSYDSTVGIVPFPMIKGGKADPTAIIYGCGNGIFHMSQKAWEDPKKREICISLLKALTSKETAESFAQESGFISNIKIDQKPFTGANMIEYGNNLVVSAKEKVGPIDSFINRGIWEDMIISQFPSVLRGSISPETVFEQVEKANCAD